MSITKLKELALAATPGPWGLEPDGGPDCYTGGPHVMAAGDIDSVLYGCGIAGIWPCESGDIGEQNADNANYIAAADPTTILALIESHQELLAAIQDDIGNRTARQKSCGHDFYCICSQDRLNSAIAKAEAL